MVEQLFNMLLELLNGDKLTAKILAEKLEVSTKTILRYVDILSLNNIPVISYQGKGGGIKIGEEYLLSNTFFDQKQLNILKTALIEAVNSNNEKDIHAILLKLSSVSKNYKTNQSLNNIVTIKSHDKENIVTNKINVIDNAITAKNYLSINYHARSGEISTRIIAPLNFLIKDGEWYIYCYCTLRSEYRTFKLTRISHLLTLADHYDIPSDYPKNWKFEFDEDILLKLEVSEAGKFHIEDWLGIECLEPQPNGSYHVSVTLTYTEDLIFKLLSFGDGIKILSPTKVIERYNSIINNIKSQY